MDIIIACLPREVDHDTGGWLASLWQAEATVTYLSAWRAHPAIVSQCLMEVLSIAIKKAWATELPTHTSAVLVATDGLGVYGLLSTLVAGAAPYAIVDFV